MISATRKGVDAFQPEGESNLMKIAQQVQNLFKFESFYDQMDFSPK